MQWGEEENIRWSSKKIKAYDLLETDGLLDLPSGDLKLSLWSGVDQMKIWISSKVYRRTEWKQLM